MIMTYIIFLIIGILIGGGAVMFFVSPLMMKSMEREYKSSTSGLDEYRKKQTEAKEKRKGEVLELMSKKDNITNNDVEKLLDVSDATATNYLQELEDDGKIEQIGKEGRSVFYKLK